MASISVVLATYQRAQGVRQVLADVAAQTLRPAQVIVVDQSLGPTAKEVRAACTQHGATYLAHAPPGLPAARNRGLAACEAPLVLFVDDDVRFGPGLLAAHVAAFADPRVGGVGGRILEQTVQPNAAQTCNRVGWNGRIHTRLDGEHATTLHTLKGCHMSFRTQVLRQAGAFDPGFAGTAYFEDADASARVRRLGWTLRFEPTAVLTHHSAPEGGVRTGSARRDVWWRAHNTARFLRKHRGLMATCLAAPTWAAIGLQRAMSWRDPAVLYAVVQGFVMGAHGASVNNATVSLPPIREHRPVYQAYLSGTGSHLPDRVVTNDDLAKEWGIETDDAWIQRRTGIRARRFAQPGVATSDLALPAVHQALASAGVQASDLDLIVFATLSPDVCFPGSGVYLQAKLGLPAEGHTVPCLDVRNQCSGFLYALSVAWAHVRAGLAQHVLVVGAEVHSAALDLTTRGRTVASLFGDGAGAVVVSRGPLQADAGSPRGVQDLRLFADGRFADDLSQRVWDMRKRPYIALDPAADGDPLAPGHVPPEDLYAQMNGKVVFKHAVARLSAEIARLLSDHDLTVDSVDHFVLHQANQRINQAIAQQLGIPSDKIPTNIARYGNTTAATLPLLLDELRQEGRVKPGDTLVLGAFGSGFTWGVGLLTW